ncbi:uncharacterized protein LOC130656666 [Hydractinia symbiolongicarpus]|uniref:uncharacterized protein LOC130656666 n=1 Tax=Hydractinia symbiolongicarpus TaxID=13093 RepID=UPI00254D997D|nr:uncharacterized protein LOC130656666 [Hydractinia symbiolongicarpus]
MAKRVFFAVLLLAATLHADKVAEFKQLLNAAIGEATAMNKNALDFKQGLSAERNKFTRTDRVSMLKRPNSDKNAQVNEYNALKAKYGSEITKNKLANELDEVIKKSTGVKIAQFDQLLQDFKNFLQGKNKGFDDQLKVISDNWKKIQKMDDWISNMEKKMKEETLGDDDIANLRGELNLISRQVQQQQFNEEEKVRSDGNSGIKQIRARQAGSKNYHSNTHSGRRFAAIHDHANNIRTVGMGEFIAVLNGVEFRTRHNDYRLKKPVSTSEFDKVEDIEFPDVPPEVLQYTSVDDQVKEMREWFKAFHEQNFKVRDYRKYFKPVLCYLEGAWTTKEGDNIEEPFKSDRHHIDANGWFDLQEKIHFTSYSGTKSTLENLAHLPTSIMEFTSEGKPVFAQWNYRILCHPLKKDLPTNLLKLVPDASSQRMTGKNETEYLMSRAARFDIEGITIDKRRSNSPMNYNLLDSLMEEIPGKNNYGAKITDSGFDAAILSARPKMKGKPLNGAYYHRPYQLGQKDAMGIDTAARGYADRFYVALTDQKRISGPSYKKVIKAKDGTKTTKTVKVRASYAIPVEIIYLTPLSKWNPYKIHHEEDVNEVKGKGTKDNAYGNTTPKLFFRTPQKFFKDTKGEVDPADTAKAGGVYMLPKGSNTPVAVHASGTRILFPEIDGIKGRIRQRYPIMPVYGEGNSVWKKLNALEDTVDFQSIITSNIKYFSTGVSHHSTTTLHTHILKITKGDLQELETGKVKEIEAYTERSNGHVHKVKLGLKDGALIVVGCDSTTSRNDMSDIVCWDNHSNTLQTSSDE